MSFVKFTESGRSFAPKASISTSGVINFNYGALKRFNLNRFKVGVLYYDKEENKVGIELSCDETSEGALKLRVRETGCDVGAKRFLDFFNISPPTLMIYDIEVGEKPDFYIINLNNGKEKEARKRNKRSQES